MFTFHPKHTENRLLLNAQLVMGGFKLTTKAGELARNMGKNNNKAKLCQ